jgi:tetratricopeptide (TPR) repeat protein
VALSAGTRLGPYEILAPLGAGGMGEVYKAKDSRVERTVAVKVLPEEFFENKESIARFEREARILASLNHPNIAAIYAFEEIPDSSSSSSRHLLVMELVEGEDLRQRLVAGPLPLDEALAYARRIAEALEAAHEKGIVHRDLKPANVKITADGRVKLLDFGLAKVVEAGPSSTDTRAATATASPTLAGVVLGTPAYMSPEQARGDAVDARADVWAFGCVLYEAISGRSPFQRPSTAETLGALFGAAPRFDEGRWSNAPAALRALVVRCLEKDPGLRPSSGRDLVAALASVRAGLSRPSWLVPAAVAALAATAVLAAWLTGRGPVAGSEGRAEGTRHSTAPPATAVSSSAFEIYERARVAYQVNTKTDNSRAIALYEEALRVDPRYAPAWAGLAFACARYSFQYFDADPAWAGRAEEAAARALELGPYLAEAYQARAQVLSSQHQNFDFRKALPEARRALELSPNLDISHYWMGVGYGLHLGLFDEGIRSLERAAEINPKWAAPVAAMGWIRLQQGRFEDALALAQKAVAMAPGFSVAYVTAADALLRLERDAEADAEVSRALEKEPRNTWALSLRAVLAARRGARPEAEALIEKASGLYDDHHVQYNAALVAASRGDAAKALACLRRVTAGNFNPYPWFVLDPLLKPVRGDAAIRAFLEESKRTFAADRKALATGGAR